MNHRPLIDASRSSRSGDQPGEKGRVSVCLRVKSHVVCFILIVALNGCVDVAAQEPSQLQRPQLVLGVDVPLYEIRDVALAGNRLFVLTSPEPAVHVFDLASANDYLAWGEEGSGPGELRNPIAIIADSGGVRVLDLVPGAPRVVTYATTGDVRDVLTISGLGIVHRLARVGDHLITEAAQFGGTERKLVRVAQPQSPVLQYTDAQQIQLVSDRGPMRSLKMHAPFVARARWTATANGGFAFWPGSGSRIELLTADGLPNGTLTLPSSTLEVAPADRETWFARQFPKDIDLFGTRDPYRGLREEATDAVTFPAHFPPVLQLQPDPGEGVWVLRAVRAKGEVWALIRGGQNPRTLVAPPGREIVTFGRNVIIATALGEGGIEIVEVYRRPNLE